MVVRRKWWCVGEQEVEVRRKWWCVSEQEVEVRRKWWCVGEQEVEVRRRWWCVGEQEVGVRRKRAGPHGWFQSAAARVRGLHPEEEKGEDPHWVEGVVKRGWNLPKRGQKQLGVSTKMSEGVSHQ